VHNDQCRSCLRGWRHVGPRLECRVQRWSCQLDPELNNQLRLHGRHSNVRQEDHRPVPHHTGHVRHHRPPTACSAGLSDDMAGPAPTPTTTTHLGPMKETSRDTATGGSAAGDSKPSSKQADKATQVHMSIVNRTSSTSSGTPTAAVAPAAPISARSWRRDSRLLTTPPLRDRGNVALGGTTKSRPRPVAPPPSSRPRPSAARPAR
jgi:hypothetical protein